MNKKTIVITMIVLLALGALFVLDYHGYIWHNNLFAMWYEVKGLDVSHHQGAIDWKVLDKKEYPFVFMKATEGHDFTDHLFQTNWQSARQEGFLTGAYHFFSMRSSGETQAMHFIQTVPNEADALPPVIDLEIPLHHDQTKVRGELQAFSDKLQAHYGKEPILYVTYETYNKYIKGHFMDHRIWIRDIYKHPTLDREWFIWQYHNRAHVDGIGTYVDINVLKGANLEKLKAAN